MAAVYFLCDFELHFCTYAHMLCDRYPSRLRPRPFILMSKDILEPRLLLHLHSISSPLIFTCALTLQKRKPRCMSSNLNKNKNRSYLPCSVTCSVSSTTGPTNRRL